MAEQTITPEQWDDVRAYIVSELRRRYPGAMPSHDALTKGIAEICGPLAAEQIDVAVNLDRGDVTVTVSVEMVEQLETILRQSAT